MGEIGGIVWLIATVATWIGWTLVFKETKPWMQRYPWVGWAGYVVIALVYVLIHQASVR